MAMKKLSKDQKERKVKLIVELTDKATEIEQDVSEINASVALANQHVQEYNALLQEVGQLQDEIVDEMDDHIADHRESWENTPHGIAYAKWRDQWQSFSCAPIEPIPEVLLLRLNHVADMEDLDHAPVGP